MMSSFWSGMVVMDPAVIDRHFDQDDTLGSISITGTEEPSEEGLAQMEQVKDILEKLPPREADFVEMYYFHRLRQTTIASIFNVSQPTICYRLQRATERIKYLLVMPVFEDGEVEGCLRSVLKDELDIHIMLGMLDTTCQSEVAKNLGVSQGLVRHRFFRSLSRLEAHGDMDKVVSAFRMVASNLNIMREVYRASWCEPTIYLLG
jgi:DNA-directed RNA polymerase specialized sigma24 family protein